MVKKRKDRRLRFYSVNFSKLGILESSLDELTPCKEDGWLNYPKGVMWTVEQKGYKIPCGIDFNGVLEIFQAVQGFLLLPQLK